METDRVTRAVQRLRELKAGGVELHDILGGQAGVAFIRDDCEGDPEVAYAAVARKMSLIYPSGQKITNVSSSTFSERTASWLKRMSEVDSKQERLLNLHLDGDITAAQFRAKSAELREARLAAEGQLEVARSRLARLEDLKRSKDELVSHYSSLVPS